MYKLMSMLFISLNKSNQITVPVANLEKQQQ